MLTAMEEIQAVLRGAGKYAELRDGSHHDEREMAISEIVERFLSQDQNSVIAQTAPAPVLPAVLTWSARAAQQSALVNAIAALKLAAECGGELDHAQYLGAHDDLVSVVRYLEIKANTGDQLVAAILKEPVQRKVLAETTPAQNLRVVITTPESGVYLGNAMGFGFWSKEDSVCQSSAVTFESVQRAEDHMATWECGRPADVKFVHVASDEDGYASEEACVAAGLPAWSDEVSYDQPRA